MNLSYMADPNLLDKIDKDPKMLGKMIKELGAGVEGGLPSEFGNVVDRLESGQSPEEITNNLENQVNTPNDDAEG